MSARLRTQSIIGLSILVLCEIIRSILSIPENHWFSEALFLLGSIATLPFDIAIFRLLILNEATSGYHFAFSTVRFPSDTVESVGNIVLIVIAVLVMVRLAVLLPAIAVDAPGASVANSVADTRSHTWFILKTYLTILLPFLAIVILAVALGSPGESSPSEGESTAASVFFAVLEFLGATSLKAISARLFMSLGDRVKGNGLRARQ